jgi:hypothetical protein
MTFQQYIRASNELGFSKVCIINRKNFLPLAHTPGAIATSYMDGEEVINENQTLLDDWSAPAMKYFRFFGKKFKIDARDGKGRWIAGSRPDALIVAYEFKTVWFIAYALHKKDKKAFDSSKDAFDKILDELWQHLIGEI